MAATAGFHPADVELLAMVRQLGWKGTPAKALAWLKDGRSQMLAALVAFPRERRQRPRERRTRASAGSRDPPSDPSPDLNPRLPGPAGLVRMEAEA